MSIPKLPSEVVEEFRRIMEATGYNENELQVLSIKYACCSQPKIAWKSGKPTEVTLKIPRVLLRRIDHIADHYGVEREDFRTSVIHQMMYDALATWSSEFLRNDRAKLAVEMLLDMLKKPGIKEEIVL